MHASLPDAFSFRLSALEVGGAPLSPLLALAMAATRVRLGADPSEPTGGPWSFPDEVSSRCLQPTGESVTGPSMGTSAHRLLPSRVLALDLTWHSCRLLSWGYLLRQADIPETHVRVILQNYRARGTCFFLAMVLRKFGKKCPGGQFGVLLWKTRKVVRLHASSK